MPYPLREGGILESEKVSSLVGKSFLTIWGPREAADDCFEVVVDLIGEPGRLGSSRRQRGGHLD